MPRPLPSGLEVRQARFSDIPSLAELFVSAPDDGSVYQFPHIGEYPDEMKQMHIDWLKSSIHDTKSLFRVAVVPGVNGAPLVVGFSSWLKREVGSSDGLSHPVDISEPFSGEELAAAKEDSSVDSTPQGSSKALERNQLHSDAIHRARQRFISPSEKLDCYSLDGLCIRDQFQGHGIGTLLMRWGLEQATIAGVPIFTSGEAQGVNFYVNALGFRRLRDSEYWLDSEGVEISREEVEAGNDTWTTAKGGLSGAEVVWCPKGYKLDVP